MKPTGVFSFIFDGKPHPIKRLGLRLIDISFMGICYFIGGITFSWIIEKLDSNIDIDTDKKDIKTVTLVVELLVFISILMIFSYFLRNIIKRLPCPFDTFWGYSHAAQSEINGGIIISFAIIVLLTTFKEKIHYLFYDKLKLL